LQQDSRENGGRAKKRKGDTNADGGGEAEMSKEEAQEADEAQ